MSHENLFLSARCACIVCRQRPDRGDLKARPNTEPGKTGKLLGKISLFFVISIAVVFTFLTPNYMKRIRMSERMSSEWNMVYRLKIIAQAEETFRQKHKRYGTIDELLLDKRLRKKWEIPIRDGYYFSAKPSRNSVVISARPINYASEPRRSFVSYLDGNGNNESSAIYGADKAGGEANRSDELIDRSLKKE